jgi:hypothetical protein
MGLQYRKRIPLGRNVWVNWSLGWPSISARVGRVVFNTKRGFSSVRLGKGFTWQDRD